MKINRTPELNTGLQFKQANLQKKEEIKDQVILGENTDTMDIVKNPLKNMKSDSGDKIFDVAHGVVGGAFALGLLGLAGEAIKDSAGMGGLVATGLLIGGVAGALPLVNGEGMSHFFMVSSLLSGGIILGGSSAIGSAAVGGILGGIGGYLR